jgi:hypothetical protein
MSAAMTPCAQQVSFSSSSQIEEVEQLILPSLSSLPCGRPDQARTPVIGASAQGGHEELVNFVIVAEDAVIHRNFAKMGHMHTYAVVSLNGTRAFKTKRTKRGRNKAVDHLKPKWGHACEVQVSLPTCLRVELYDQSKLHRDVVCGSSEINLTSLSDSIGEHTLTLQKHVDEVTAQLRLTIKEPARLSSYCSGQQLATQQQPASTERGR